MPSVERENQNKYWEVRQHLLYYNAVRILTRALGDGATSIVDVGSAGCPYLDWFSIPEKFSVDIENPYRAPDVTAVRADFLQWEPARRFDIVTCLQVLEHIPSADLFAAKLLSIGNIVIASVPYMWEKGRVQSHVNDPVNRKKMREWFGRDPNFDYLCHEVAEPTPRLIQVYENDAPKWKDLRERSKQQRARAAERAKIASAPTPA